MLHVSISLYPGRTSEMKKEMAEKIVKCLVDSYKWQPGDISVSLEEIPKDDFANKINEKISNEELLMQSDYIKKER